MRLKPIRTGSVGLAVWSLIAGIPLAAQVAEPSARIQRAVEDLMLPLAERDMVSGSVLIAQGGEISFAGGFGQANRDYGLENTIETRFRIASVSKSLTAVAVLQLVESDLVELDAALVKYLPDYPHGQKITIRQLLNHSSGIPSTPFVEGYYEKSLLDHSLEQSISWFQDEPLRFEPGERFEYSNSGYILLSRLIEVVSDLPYERYLEQHVLGPSGMKHSGLDSRGRIVEGRATGYSRGPEGQVERAAYRNPRECFGCGALFSTVADLFRFERALAEKRLLTLETLDMMWSPAFDTPWGDRYGMGWFIGEHMGRDVVVAKGGTSGFMSILRSYIEDDVVVIALLNQDFMLHSELFERLAGIALDEPWEPLFASSNQDPRDHPLAAFAGQYRMEDGARLVFSVGSGGFFLEEEGPVRRFEVYPLDDVTGFAADVNARLTFRPATEEEPVRLRALYGVLLWEGERVAPPSTESQ